MTLWDKVLFVGGICSMYFLILALVAWVTYIFMPAWAWTSRPPKKKKKRKGDSDQ